MRLLGGAAVDVIRLAAGSHGPLYFKLARVRLQLLFDVLKPFPTLLPRLDLMMATVVDALAAAPSYTSLHND